MLTQLHLLSLERVVEIESNESSAMQEIFGGSSGSYGKSK